MSVMNKYLVDTSVWNRAIQPAVGELLVGIGAENRISTCASVIMEYLYSARDLAGYKAMSDDFLGVEEIFLNRRITVRAREIQAALVAKSQHRGPGPVDLLIAACADVAGDTVLHYDRHFEVIGDAAGVAHQWAAPAESIE